MDAADVKAEIKNWEHEFRAQNGRSATIEDVKGLPRMAEKYKLYKKLTKEAGQTKGKGKEIQFHTPVKKCTPSPDPFIPAQSHLTQQNAAIVKARKRLRGESVSPSPLPRDKRRRASGLDSFAQSRRSQTRSVSPPEHNAEEGDSFVDDSPVKAPAGIKTFTPLFEEAMSLSQPAHPKAGNLTTRGRAFSRAKTLPTTLFGSSLPATSTSTVTQASRKRKVVEHESHEHKSHDEHPGSNLWRLLPPSPPPPQDDNGGYNVKRKGKGKMDTAQKKTKKIKLSAADEEDNATSSDDVEVKIVPWRGGPRSPQTQEKDLTLTVDPELQQFHLRTGRPASSSLEKFEVDLPEEMRRFLALSQNDVRREREEEDLVKGLIRGRRRVEGEVWAPGEIRGEFETTEEDFLRLAEEDWEGDGIPWEVAEL